MTSIFELSACCIASIFASRSRCSATKSLLTANEKLENVIVRAASRKNFIELLPNRGRIGTGPVAHCSQCKRKKSYLLTRREMRTAITGVTIFRGVSTNGALFAVADGFQLISGNTHVDESITGSSGAAIS